MSQHMEKIFRTPGDDPNHPYILKTAFTGTAAANIKGQTLHTAFSFNFGNEFISLGDKARDDKRKQLENLKVLIIDKFSMIKSDLLYQLDLRLREVKQEPKLLFGGVAVFLFGDILQLRPVKARYIFDEPASESFNLSFLTDPLWQKFDVVLLRYNHRQGEDGEYADILNRIRMAEIQEEDVKLLETRIRPLNHPDIPKDALVISCTNAEVNKINEEKLTAIDETLHTFTAINKTRTSKSLKPRIDSAGSITGTPLQKSLNLKIGAKVMLTFNIHTYDCLTNGTFGEIVGFNFDQSGNIIQVYVHFYDEDCGKLRRQNYVSLQNQFPGKNVTPIDLIEFQYSLSKKGNSSNATATAIQFPLKLAFAATAHKIQGLTIKKPNFLVIDLRTVREPAQAYVILSRIQALSQLFILKSLCVNKMISSEKAMQELERLNTVAMNQTHNKTRSVISCNIRSYRKHSEDLLTASTLEYADVICLQETWLDPEEEVREVKAMKQHNNSVGRGKGVMTLFKSNYCVVKDITKEKYQMTKLASETKEIINIYKSSDAKDEEFRDDLIELINFNKETLVMGDFNICYINERSNLIVKALEDVRFVQHVKFPTHIEGRLIDHFYSFSPGTNRDYDVKQQAQYFTDHDLIDIRQAEKGKLVFTY